MDNRTEKRKIGDLGENIACEWLENKGFSVILRNYSKKWGEIDIIAKKSLKLHFIEVKTVTRENLDTVSLKNDVYRPEDNIHPWKLKRISRTIQAYLLEKDLEGEDDWQFDVVTVYLDSVRKLARVCYEGDIVI